MKIITIDREFGSGGRELGKRLSEALQIPCYDQEIIEEVARLHNLDPAHVEHLYYCERSFPICQELSGSRRLSGKNISFSWGTFYCCQ